MMATSSTLRLGLAVAVAALTLAVRSSAQTQYSVQQIGANGTYVYGINNSGTIVGSMYGPAWGTSSAFQWANGQITIISGPAGTPGAAYGISNSGSVVGPGFVYQNGQLTNLEGGEAYAVNSSNVATGGNGHAVEWDASGQPHDLGTLGGAESEGLAINDTGQIAGWSYGPTPGAEHAFLYCNGAMHDLGALAAGQSSMGYAINSHGDVVGWGGIQGPRYDVSDAFLYKNGVMQGLPTLAGFEESVAWGINDSDQVVGDVEWDGIGTNSYGHAMIYENGLMYDLNDLVPAGSG